MKHLSALEFKALLFQNPDYKYLFAERSCSGYICRDIQMSSGTFGAIPMLPGDLTDELWDFNIEEYSADSDYSFYVYEAEDIMNVISKLTANLQNVVNCDYLDEDYIDFVPVSELKEFLDSDSDSVMFFRFNKSEGVKWVDDRLEFLFVIDSNYKIKPVYPDKLISEFAISPEEDFNFKAARSADVSVYRPCDVRLLLEAYLNVSGA